MWTHEAIVTYEHYDVIDSFRILLQNLLVVVTADLFS
jgi:hypothetical protein